MNADAQNRLAAQLMIDEDLKLSAYQDSLGYWTLGYGHLIDARRGGRISPAIATYILQDDITTVLHSLSSYAWFSAQDDVRQGALANMAFNLGLTGLLHFPKFLMHMGLKEYPLAVAEIQGTPWHDQVGARADRIIHMILTGAWT